MPFLDSLLRQTLLIKRLQQKNGSTFIELQEHIQNHSQLNRREYGERTFQRDKITIRETHNIEIQYDRKNNVHKITTPIDELNVKALESFEMLNALLGKENFSEYIHFESRKSQGIQYFQSLLRAIKDHKLIKFKHQKFYEDIITDRLVEPYALKEFKGRWYLLAKDYKDDKVKTFGLDKISEVEIKPKKFKYPLDFDPKTMFRNCFGIITPNIDDQIQEIILEFDPEQANYIRSFPLHSSQEAIPGTEDGVQFKLKLYITYDFIMELLSYGENVKVLKPEALANEMKELHRRAFVQY